VKRGELESQESILVAVGWVRKTLAISVVLQASGCGSMPGVVRRQVDVRTLEEVRVEGHPKWGEEVRAGQFRVKFLRHADETSASSPQSGTRGEVTYTATVSDGDRFTEWECQMRGNFLECSQNSLKLMAASPVQVRPNNLLRFTTSRSEYDGFTYEENSGEHKLPVVVGVFRNFVHTKGEVDPETNNPWEPVQPKPVAFIVRDKEGIQLLLPRGEEHAELRAMMVLAVAALGWMNWSVRPGGGGFWAYSPTWN